MAKSWTGIVGAVFVVAGAAAGYWCFSFEANSLPPVEMPPLPQAPEEAGEESVRQFCGTSCHGYPPPDSFPRSAWRKEVEQGYYLAGRFRPDLHGPPLESVLAHYENRAPLVLKMPPRDPAVADRPPVQWRRRAHAKPGGESFPQIVNVNVARLWKDGSNQIVICECDPLKNEGRVFSFDPRTSPPTWKELARLPVPVHTEIVDLDGDGRLDILVACLGRFFPSDDRTGSVVWLRGRDDGSFEAVTLLRDVGRVADVQTADFNGDGKPDLVVAEFGWRAIGSVLLLENRTEDWSQPRFERRLLDDRHGALNVPVADLNGDGKPDFVALFSQEHETVVAFLNDGGGEFHKKTIFSAPHPAYGSSGMQLVDLDADGDLDVLYTNGDVLDKPFLLKPYHGVHWLENRGAYPFAPHRLANMPGVMRAVAADLRGVGRPDIFAVSYLPVEEFPGRDSLDLDSVLWLEQSAPGQYRHRPLETRSCDHFTCTVGDLNGDGRLSLVVGNFWSSRQRPLKDALGLWTPPKPFK